MTLGDKCYKCGKRANPIPSTTDKRWHHCPRCGITFNKDSKSSDEIRKSYPGFSLAEKYKR